ncbi:MAG: 3-deoxy-D-manno-octulosonic acid transferase [Gammaproteobacteria bacterium 39-13]|nr:lipid IV(A) 3-deoxy-D-manno-octulosonic acid transferase [Gammaproteobacteria bacterium]OJV90411.1 MAG: 3-deoxy-D-manno-octulosonic acid transferase [Gammaproteobacteria bacterium 39-13]
MVWRYVRWFYSVAFTCLLPWVFFRLWVRSLRLPAYRRRWLERLGQIPLPPIENVLWVHAVSVGETVAAIPLIHRIRAQYPQTPILMTTTTPTGSERVQAAFKDMLGKQIYHCYLPYDLPWALRAFFKRVKPKLLVLMETELWPNLLHACYQKQLPVLIANARLSPISARRYGWLGRLMKAMLRPVCAVAAQSAIDAKRFNHLGVDQKKIWETGNIKFDLHLPSYLQEAGLELRQELGKSRIVWIAASTHEGEETIMLNVYQALKERFKDLLLFLVPRHPDRFNKVASLCTERGFNIIRRSQKQSVGKEVDIFLGDSMGEMPLFYAASDIAFVGGSFVPVGGHNLLEPAALGLPVLTGPQLFNFVAISEMLVAAKGATIVQDEDALKANLIQLFENHDMRQMQGQKAKVVVEENRGALDRLLKLIDDFWQKQSANVQAT